MIAAENQEITGWILMGEGFDRLSNKNFGFIYELFVLEKFRGRGIAKKLIKAAIETERGFQSPIECLSWQFSQ